MLSVRLLLIIFWVWPLTQEDPYKMLREQMVVEQIEARGIIDSSVLTAMRTVERHKFVSSSQHKDAYDDSPLPIGFNQTISQPYIVAYMTEKLELDGTERVLEIGTGSGYQAAVLARCADFVYSIEIVAPLCKRARITLQKLGYRNVDVRCGDGYQGWPEHAPFDAIILTAAPKKIPEPLIEQLAPGGRLIAPVGGSHQQLVRLFKTRDQKIKTERLLSVRFVPFTR